jgi:serine/threonine-protein kinase
VTGVQTCALPIYGREPGRRRDRTRPADAGADGRSAPPEGTEPPPSRHPPIEEPAAPQGQGKLDIVAEPYAIVVIDGKTIGPTPRLGYRVPAGRHTITLNDPVTGDVVLTKVIEVPVDGKVRVARP